MIPQIVDVDRRLGRGDLAATPPLVVVEVGRQLRASLCDGLELAGQVPVEAESADLGDVANLVQGDGLTVGGGQFVGVGRVGLVAGSVAEPVVVGVVGEVLGFGRTGFAAQAVEVVVAVLGGAARQAAALDVAVGVVGQGFVGLGGDGEEERGDERPDRGHDRPTRVRTFVGQNHAGRIGNAEGYCRQGWPLRYGIHCLPTTTRTAQQARRYQLLARVALIWKHGLKPFYPQRKLRRFTRMFSASMALILKVQER